VVKQGRDVVAAKEEGRQVMRSLLMVLTVAVLLLVPGDLFAQRDTEGLAERIQDLQLTDDQEAQIAAIRKEYRPKVQKASKDLAATVKDEVGKVQAVLTDKQKKTLQETKAERRQVRGGERLAERIAHLQELDLTRDEMTRIAAIRKEFHPRIAKAMKGLEGLLSAEQKEARAEALKAGKKRREVIAALKLTDNQKAKVAAVGKEVRTLVREELEKIGEVLSEGQKEKIREFREERREHVRDRMAHRIATLKDLDLTNEQKSQIAEIRKKYRPMVHEAGNDLRGTVREEVAKIIAVLKG
jgi:Spy/CpxP family protein refolding chaperone